MGLAIGLEVTLDILSAVKAQREKTGYPRVSLGFAAETHDALNMGGKSCCVRDWT
ncbi:MAG: phosphopantothenoylcysteine decarboxylase [Chloroflexi bacterium]|nr:phosphopantothenoylcysteine decarboxylase [Chloroflexota bacterium]